MLSLLRIRNLAIVDELELELGPGLNVITGETGAGKSILVTALKLVLGARGRADLLRTGAERAEVEALFDLGRDPGPRQGLRDAGVEVEDELVVRRALLASGRTRAYVNGRLATAAELGRVAAGLVDISSQHEHHTLAHPGNHLAFLDAYAGLQAQREQVAALHGALVEAGRALAQAREGWRDRTEREDLLRYQLGEIEQIDPQPGEDQRLEAERERLRHGEALRDTSVSAEAALYGEDGAICERLAGLGAELGAAARFDEALAGMAERVDGARLELEEVARDLGAYASGLDTDPARLAALEDRLDALRRLTRKHGTDLTGLLSWGREARDELARLEGGEQALGELESAREQALARAAVAARVLSEGRHRAAEALGTAITEELADLGMGDAQVQVDVAPLAGEGAFAVDGARLDATGLDRAEFLIAPNPGEQPRPLARVASGGELSRALLALKRVLAGAGPVGLYVFDEVDAGVGGAVGEAIGRKLRQVSRHHQVLCITHLAQVAVFADTHLRVQKDVDDGRTRSQVRRLDDAASDEEIARMLGGQVITEATREAARELRRTALLE